MTENKNPKCRSTSSKTHKAYLQWSSIACAELVYPFKGLYRTYLRFEKFFNKKKLIHRRVWKRRERIDNIG